MCGGPGSREARGSLVPGPSPTRETRGHSIDSTATLSTSSGETKSENNLKK